MNLLKTQILLTLALVSFSIARFEHNIEEDRHVSLSLKDNSCNDWFKPCSCFTEALTENIYVTCQHVSPSAVFEAFNRPDTPTTEIYSMTYLMSDTNEPTYLPSNLLGQSKIVDSCKLMWEGRDFDKVLTINANAFASSSDSMRKLTMAGFNVNNLNWSFLNTLKNLKNLALIHLRNMESFAALPIFESPLTYLMVQNCTGVFDIPDAPQTLEQAEFAWTQMTDSVANKVVERLSRAHETLRELGFSHVPLTSVPETLDKLSNMEIINLGYTNIEHMASGAFPAAIHFKGLSLRQSTIREIEAGAFQSNFSGATVSLVDTPLERFEADVFKSMLTSMFCHDSGVLYLTNCNFTCDCSLAWLVRDNSHLMNHLVDGTCANSTSFQELNAAGFEDCESTAIEPLCGVTPTEFSTEPTSELSTSKPATGGCWPISRMSLSTYLTILLFPLILITDNCCGLI